MAATIALVVLMALSAASWIAVRAIASDRDAELNERINGVAPSFARQLLSRLQMANAMVQYLAAPDAGAADAVLRQRVLASDTFGSVFFLPWQTRFTDADVEADDAAMANLPSFGPSDRQALIGGQSLLKAVASASGGLSVYLAHIVNSAGTRQIAFFELSPNWLWQGAQGGSNQPAIAVLDTAGRVMQLPPLRRLSRNSKIAT